MMRALIVSNPDGRTSDLRRLVERHGYECSETDLVDLEVGAEYAGRLRRELIVICMTSHRERTLSVLREIRAVSEATIVLVGPADDPKYILRSLQEGADEYVDEAEVEAELERMLVRFKQQAAVTGGEGFVTCIVGSAGGVGASTFAANLGMALTRQMHDTVIFDLCMRAADQATLLDLKPRYTVADLCRRGDRMDVTMLRNALALHTSGLGLLSSPSSVDDRMRVTSNGIRMAIAVAQRAFQHVLMDLDRSLGAEQLAALVRADLVLLALRFDMISVRNASRLLSYFNELGIRRERIRLVGCQVGQKFALKESRVQDALGIPVWSTVRDDSATANRCQNSGVPAVISRPRSFLARDVEGVATKLLPLAEKLRNLGVQSPNGTPRRVPDNDRPGLDVRDAETYVK